MANDHVASPIRDILNAFAGLPPFKEGDTVRIKGQDHLGLHRVDSCEWFDCTSPGVMPYWLVECSEIREPIDWSKIPAGATGIVTHSGWRGSASRLERASS